MKNSAPLLVTLSSLITFTLVGCGSKKRDAFKNSASLASFLSASSDSSNNLNNYFLATMDELIQKDSNLGYSSSDTGQHTQDLFYAGEKVFTAQTKKTHCVGITFQLLLQGLNKYYNATADDNVWNLPASYTTWSPFKECWYVNGACTSAGFALEKYGMGLHFTDFSLLQAGDFVQFWRTDETGHAVMFLNYINNANNIVATYSSDVIGFEYFSSQGSTKGIGKKRGYFTGQCQTLKEATDCNIIPSSIEIGRVIHPSKFTKQLTPAIFIPLSDYNSSLLFRKK